MYMIVYYFRTPKEPLPVSEIENADPEDDAGDEEEGNKEEEKEVDEKDEGTEKSKISGYFDLLNQNQIKRLI